jgi:hypothetical protein
VEDLQSGEEGRGGLQRTAIESALGIPFGPQKPAEQDGRIVDSGWGTVLPPFDIERDVEEAGRFEVDTAQS